MYNKEFYRAAAEELVEEHFNEDVGYQYTIKDCPYIYDVYSDAVDYAMELLKANDEEENL